MNCERGSTMNVIIRREEETDYQVVERITREAFWKEEKAKEKGYGCDEHYLAHVLRQSPDFVPELDLVAEVDGQVVGNIMYTLAKLKLTNATELEVLNFGPLTVKPEFQNQGIGSALVKYSLEEAKKMGFDAVVIFGHPNYYPRFGFKEASEFHICTKEGKNFPAFMALEIYEGSLHGLGASFHESEAFQMDPEKVKEFDLQFAKKKYDMEALVQRILSFRDERDWEQFHTPENLSKSIVIEAAELLENFQWGSESYHEENVKEELADVMIYCIHLANQLGIDFIDVMEEKMKKNELKYPVSKSKGSSKKYTQL